MKRIFIYVAILLGIGAAAHAQPTIIGAGCEPMAGEIYYGHHFDTAARTEGPSGAGITWNYLTANVFKTDTIPFVSCSSTPYCDSFPGSTLASPDGFGGYYYFVTDGTKFAANGHVTGDSDLQHYSKPGVIVPFPFSYGDVSADSFSWARPRLGLYADGVDSFIADAYGSVLVPPATRSNVLRIHHINYTRDSTAGVSPAKYSRAESFLWVEQDVHYPQLTLSYDTLGDVRHVSDMTFYTKDVTGVPGLTRAGGKLQVYPNPASSTAYVNYVSSASGDATVMVTDLLGRATIAPMPVRLNAGANEIPVDVSGMPRGVYVLQVNVGSERHVAKLVVE